jgi:hypothetical protein
MTSESVSAKEWSQMTLEDETQKLATEFYREDFQVERTSIVSPSFNHFQLEPGLVSSRLLVSFRHLSCLKHIFCWSSQHLSCLREANQCFLSWDLWIYFVWSKIQFAELKSFLQTQNISRSMTKHPPFNNLPSHPVNNT